MRLFHVSEEANIREFVPRTPLRKDLAQDVGLVWAIDEAHLPNFLTPRECPRVGYRVNGGTTAADQACFFTCEATVHAVIIEQGWLERCRHTTLYLYEFDPPDFLLQDVSAGYYVATRPQQPIARHKVTNLLGELARREMEVRFVPHLWDIAEAVKHSTLDWSLCRMRGARAKPRGAPLPFLHEKTSPQLR